MHGALRHFRSLRIGHYPDVSGESGGRRAERNGQDSTKASHGASDQRRTPPKSDPSRYSWVVSPTSLRLGPCMWEGPEAYAPRSWTLDGHWRGFGDCRGP